MSSADLAITGGTVVGPYGAEKKDVYVSDEKIVQLADPSQPAPMAAVTTVDATGKHVIPGMIDVHVHTREPGYTHKEDIITCTRGAAAGGVTTIFGMPNLDPPTVSGEYLSQVLDLYAEKSIVDYNHNPVPAHGEVESMAAQGVAAYKVYMVVDTGRTYPHPAGTGIRDHGHLLQMFDDVAETGLVFMVHPHDQAIMDLVEQRFWAEGDRSPQAYAKTLATHDGLIWDAATAVLIQMSEATGCPLHIVHAQTTRGIEMIRQAKARGLKVTAEVNHWALFLGSWDDVNELGSYALSYWVPDHHKEAVWEGIADGTIDMVSSDHAPHTREEKEVGWEDAWAAHTGTPGIQHQLPLLLDAVHRGKLSIERAVELTAEGPAQTFGLENKGRIAVGSDADIAIVDLKQAWTITDDTVESRIGWTPYNGREIVGQVDRTYVRGIEVYREGEVVGVPGTGKQATPRNYGGAS